MRWANILKPSGANPHAKNRKQKEHAAPDVVEVDGTAVADLVKKERLLLDRVQELEDEGTKAHVKGYTEGYVAGLHHAWKLVDAMDGRARKGQVRAMLEAEIAKTKEEADGA